MPELVMTSWRRRLVLALVFISTGASGGVRPLDIQTEFIRAAEAPALQLAASAPPPLPRRSLPSLFVYPPQGQAPGEIR